LFGAASPPGPIYHFHPPRANLVGRGARPPRPRPTPMTYRGRDGRQYVVVSAGGHGVPQGLPLGDHVVAFALPRK
jgi:quinoprotein glucose dehydrogenase